MDLMLTRQKGQHQHLQSKDKLRDKRKDLKMSKLGGRTAERGGKPFLKKHEKKKEEPIAREGRWPRSNGVESQTGLRKNKGGLVSTTARQRGSCFDMKEKKWKR